MLRQERVARGNEDGEDGFYSLKWQPDLPTANIFMFFDVFLIISRYFLKYINVNDSQF